MGKKRRVSWPVGGLTLAVVLLIIVAIVFGRLAPDRRMDAKLSQVIAEYDFDQVIHERGVAKTLETRYYRALELSDHQMDEVVATLCGTVSGCTIVRERELNGPGIGYYYFDMDESLALYDRIELNSSARGVSGLGNYGPNYTYIFVLKRRLSLMQLIRKSLPW